MVNPASSFTDPGLFPPPEVAVARHPAVLLAPRQLKQWVEQLPLANPTRAANDILQQLRLQVRDPDPGHRLGALLQLYAYPLEALLEIVRERLAGNPDNALPLDQLEYQVVEVLNELSAGYIRIANDRIRHGKPPQAEDLYRALAALEQALHIKRLHYHRRTPEDWASQLRLFAHAENLQVADLVQKAPIRRADQPSTVRGLFLTSLIIDLCDPNHRRPAEIQHWSAWTAEHTALLELTLLPQGAYSVPLDVSGTMSPMTAARLGKPGPDTRYLDTAAFLQAAQAEVPGLKLALLELVKGRRRTDQRNHARQQRQQPYRLVFGLRAMYQRLNTLTRGLAPDSAHPSNEAIQINHSRDGSAFVLHGPQREPLSVGEPLLAESGTQNPNGAPVGFTAVVERFVNNADNRLEIGVRKMRGRLIPVVIQGSGAEQQQLDPHALLQQDNDTGRYLLLAARGWFRADEHLNVEGPTARYRLRMLRTATEMLHTARIEVEISEG
jgi:hypothetical protein